MRVVLDSNIVKSTQFQFRTAHIAAVLAAAPQLHVEILLPEVVVLEVRELYRREMQQRWANYRKSVKQLNDILTQPLPNSVEDRFDQRALSSYRAQLEKRLLGRGFRRLYLPEIDQRQILDVAVSKRKPFGGNDGYKDYLIWRSILAELERDSTNLPLYFISENHNDFAESSEANTLHPDFTFDLEERGLPPDAVAYYSTVREFQDKVINPQLHFLEEVSTKVLKGEFENQVLYADVPEAIASWLDTKLHQVSIEAFGLPASVDWLESVELLEITRYVHADARSIHNDELTIDLVVEAKCRFLVEVDQNSELGMEFSESHFVVGPQAVSGFVTKTLKFTASSLVGPAPKRQVIRMDAILLADR